MKKLKKSLSLLMAVLMLLSLVPFSASAATVPYTDGIHNYLVNDKGTEDLSDDSLTLVSIAEPAVLSINNLVLGIAQYNNTYVAYYNIGDGENTIFAPFIDTTHQDFNFKSVRIAGGYIADFAFICLSCDEFYIGASGTTITDNSFTGAAIKKFIVDEENPDYFSDESGFLYSKPYKILWTKYPAEIIDVPWVGSEDPTPDNYTVPDGIETIDISFNSYKANSITFPTSLTSIGDNCFVSLAIGRADKFPVVYYKGTIDQWNEITIGKQNGRITYSHLFCEDWYVSQEATCTLPEIQRRDCHCSDDCSKYETRESAPALGHDTVNQTDYIAPTCKTEGANVYKCSRCQTVHSIAVEIDPTNHEGPLGERNARLEPTCTQPAKKADKYCTACSKTITTGETTAPALGHNYTQKYINSASVANCAKKGYIYIYCSNNGCTKYTSTLVETDPDNHYGQTISKKNYVAATCSAEGYSGDYCCESCGALVHSCGDTPNENCYGCFVGYPKGKVTPATGKHKYEGEWTIETAPTCVTKGLESRTCIECNIKKTYQYIPLTGEHIWSDWEIIKEPTCITEGEKQRFCSVDKHEPDTASIPATDMHNFGEWYKTKDPTCGVEGEEQRDCTNDPDCHETRPISATGEHVWSEWKIIKEPTCLVEGEKQRNCQNCEEVDTETINKADHKYKEKYTVIKYSNCTEEGIGRYYCQEKDNGCIAYYDIGMEKVDHSYHSTKYEIILEPTCITEGKAIYNCVWYNICGQTNTKSIPKTGKHVFSDTPSKTKPGQCNSEGWNEYKCISDPECTETEKTPIPRNPDFHNSGLNYDVGKKAPTCCHTGYTGDATCKGCGVVIVKGNTIASTGEHELREDITSEPTCSYTGKANYYCTLSNNYIKSETLDKNPNNHSSVETVGYVGSTCVSQGYSGDKICKACHKTVSEGHTLDLSGHHDLSTNGKCTRCAKKLCNCSCHGGGFERAIFNMFKWLYKLFRTNKSCSCGNVHY